MRGGRDPSRDAGFTLLEVLTALVLFGLIGVMLQQGLQFVLRAARLTSEEARGDSVAVDRALRLLIERADPGTFPEPATLRGDADILSLTTELPTGEVGQLQRADATLSVMAGRLVLRWRRHLHAEMLGAGPAWTETVVADGVERVAFAYWGNSAGAWASAWAGEKLPRLVRVQVTYLPARGRRWPPLVVAPLREALEE